MFGHRKRDKRILWGLLAFGLLTFPFWLRKRPLKDWIITYLQTGFFAALIDSIFVEQQRLSYPIRFLKKAFTINVLFGYLLFPVVGIFYNLWTYRSGLKGIIGKAFLFTVPLTILETWFAMKTKLIKWKRWTWFHTFSQATGYMLMGRGLMALIRKVPTSTLPDKDKNPEE